MNALILLAAGSGTRIQDFISDKATAVLNEKSVILYSLEAFIQTKCFDQTLIVHRDSAQKETLEAIIKSSAWKDLEIDYVRGGGSRADSVYNALSVLAGKDSDLTKYARVAIHDVARPLIHSDFIKTLMVCAQKHLHVVPASKLVDSIKQVQINTSEEGSGRIEKNLDRSHLRSVQTPQIFDFAKLLSAHKALKETRTSFTDDASILESAGESVYYLENPRPNPKITTKSDWDYILYLLNQNAL